MSPGAQQLAQRAVVYDEKKNDARKDESQATHRQWDGDSRTVDCDCHPSCSDLQGKEPDQTSPGA